MPSIMSVNGLRCERPRAEWQCPSCGEWSRWNGHRCLKEHVGHIVCCSCYDHLDGICRAHGGVN